MMISHVKRDSRTETETVVTKYSNHCNVRAVGKHPDTCEYAKSSLHTFSQLPHCICIQLGEQLLLNSNPFSPTPPKKHTQQRKHHNGCRTPHLEPTSTNTLRTGLKSTARRMTRSDDTKSYQATLRHKVLP